jgi:hypothetical protein
LHKFKVRTTFDFYGASSLLGLQGFHDVSWVHGWEFSALTTVRQLLDPVEEFNEIHLVWTNKQSEFLKESGIHNVRAVGAPILYALDALKSRGQFPHERRQECLIFPPHSILKNRDRKRIFDYVVGLKNANYRILAALSSRKKIFKTVLNRVDYDDAALRLALENEGITVVLGADISSSTTLLNLAKLFLTSEYMITPALGSHIIYGLAMGCTVIFDRENFLPFTEEDVVGHVYMNDHSYRRTTLDAIRRQYDMVDKFDFINAEAGTQNLRNWALSELGSQNAVPVGVLASELKKFSGSRKQFRHLRRKIMYRSALMYSKLLT